MGVITVSILPTRGKAPFTAALTAQVIGGDGKMDYVYLWEYGDGTTGRINPTQHVYHMPGVYTIVCYVYDATGTVLLGTGTSTVTVYEWDYAGGINVSTTDVCLRHAIPQEPAQGIGWSLYDDVNEGQRTDAWPYPEGLIGTQNYIDENEQVHHLVLDSRSFRFYELGAEDVWQDGTDDYAGGEVESQIEWRTHMPPVGATARLKHSQDRVDLKPWFNDLRNTGEYNADGFRGDNETDVYVKTGGDNDIHSITKQVPRRGQIVFDRKVDSEFIQGGVYVRGAPWRLTRVQQFFTQEDTAAGPPEKLMSEHSWMLEWSEPLVWISRYAEDPLMNLANGTAFTGAVSGLTTGPDARPRSAFGLTALVSQDLSQALSGDFTVSMWVRTPADGLKLLEIANPNLKLILDDMADGWRLRYDDSGNTLDFYLDTEFTTWTMVTVKRSGENVTVYENGAVVNTGRLAVATNAYAGLVSIGAGVVSLFDVRINASAVGTDAVKYLYDDVVQNQGNSLLPVY